ncbi:hypothetical protein BACCIP111895_01236 [Neobacillus rhizosphaerae]|uniref:Uncharacterized protein n=1 Tax=Neobacillus rhizosphaerae TaxID=2880965 RepID=A0ABN8KKX7_9BACI|nr:hypothetical protein BACCIP111895_01236 [Neobacillus rhizosphaerae]
MRSQSFYLSFSLLSQKKVIWEKTPINEVYANDNEQEAVPESCCKITFRDSLFPHAKKWKTIGFSVLGIVVLAVAVLGYEYI